jgi:hypothetical protein
VSTPGSSPRHAFAEYARITPKFVSRYSTGFS